MVSGPDSYSRKRAKSFSSYEYRSGNMKSASGWPRQNSFSALVLGFTAALILIFYYLVAGPIDLFWASLMLIASCILVAFRFGPLSAQSLIYLSVYIPSLAFFWAHINGARYINSHSHWLQDSLYYVNSSVHLSLLSALVSLSVMALFPSKKRVSRSIGVVEVGVSTITYMIWTLASGFFFWLTDPSFKTIITHTYTEILSERIPNTQFAGPVAVLFWLGALVNYLRLTEPHRIFGRQKILANRLFIFITVCAIVWLALHARRSELVGMALVLVVVSRDRIGFLKTLVLGAVLFAVLVVAGEIRSASLLGMFSSNYQTSQMDIARMPGGASNVFMTFVNTVHYFDFNNYFCGETFLNYFGQILPTPIYRILGANVPDYFFQTVYTGNYSYNGSTYILAIFFGNFGLFGVGLGGIVIGLYACASRALIRSSNFVLKITGFFMLAMSFRGFWYEPIAIIKPMLIVLIPGLVIFSALRATQRPRATHL